MPLNLILHYTALQFITEIEKKCMNSS